MENARHLLLSVIFLSLHVEIKAAGCPSFNINYPPMRTLLCPGDIITYTCTLYSNFGLVSITTWWTGSGFTCPATNPTNTIVLTQATGTPPFTVPVSCGGNLSAAMTNITNISGACYTSVLTIPTPQYFNGTTVMCKDGNFGTLIGSDTLNIQLASSPGPVMNIAVTSTLADQLTVTWTPPTTGGVPTSYNITINDSSNTQASIPANGPLKYTFSNLTNGTLYTVSVVAINCAGSSKTTGSLPPTTTTASSTTGQSSPEGGNIGAIAGGVVGGVGGALLLVVIVVIVVVVILKTKGGKGGSKKSEDTMELGKSGSTSTPPPGSNDGTGAMYQDPKAIQHVQGPGGETYAMADKPTKTSTKASDKAKKPTATVAPAAGGMYQDPKDIQHTTSSSGETYAVADKKPKPVN